MTARRIHARGRWALARLALLLGATACSGSTETGDNAPLYAAIEAGDTARARTLLDDGADPNSRVVRTRVGERRRAGSRGAPPPLTAAILAGRPEIVRLLLAKGARAETPDDDGYLPLEHGVERGDTSIVGALLKHGADPRASSKHGFPLLLSAASRGHHAVAMLLVRHGADVDARDTAGRALAHFRGTQVENVAGRLSRRPPAPAPTNATALMLAAIGGDSATVAALLGAGAGVNATDSRGRTALMLAVEQGISASVQPRYLGTARVLLARGADPLARDASGSTALDRARSLAGISPTHAELARLLESRARR